MSSKPHSQDPEILEAKEEFKGKFIKLESLKWKDQEGRERSWETANRTTRSKGGVDAVAILTLLHHPRRPLSTVIIEQFRPPIGKYVVELPAGLIDEGEDAATTALRELHEETGFGGGKPDEKGEAEGDGQGKGKVGFVSPVLVADPGMSGANMNLVTVDIYLGENDPEPEQKLEPGEHIVKRVVPLQDLHKILLDYDKKGFAVDGRLAHFALGWEMSNNHRSK